MKYPLIAALMAAGCETSGEFGTGELGSPEDTGELDTDDPEDTDDPDEEDSPEDTDELDDPDEEDSPEDTGELDMGPDPNPGPGEGFLACHEISEAEYCGGPRMMWSLTWKPYLDGCVAVTNVRYCPNECVSEWDTDEDGNTYMDYYCI